MAVLPSIGGSGIASQLWSRAESELHQRKGTRVRLDTAEALLPSDALSGKHRYRSSGKSKEFFGRPLIAYPNGWS